ncbi:MAG TPA: histidinol dehydrogenase [Thermoanaerobaculia bacterium]|nr:histidinol dehydrogenase [Thermoanaerobaculia bacterium]
MSRLPSEVPAISGEGFPVVPATSGKGRRLVARLTGRGREVLDARVRREAERLVRAVRRGGDTALLEAVRRLDDAEAVSLALGPPNRRAVEPEVPEPLREAMEGAIAAVDAFHRPQLHPGYRRENDGVELEEVRAPLRRVGLYVPGGRAAYPSTVIMTVVPARVAGVAEIAVATPPAAYRAHPALRWVLARLGVTEVWGMGGAHAVAALAYGTETIPRVDKVCGPGNAWVTAAKRAVVGDVGIDGLAGPTEVVIVADAGTDAAWLAADLLAQAEHDPRAAAVLVTRSRALAEEVAAEVARQLATLPTAETARAALARYGGALLVGSAGEALELVEAIAPEHLQLVGPEAEALAPRIANAGATFLGAHTSEVFGDYLAGPSHVLPTCGSARFSSALGVEDFIRRSHRVRLSGSAAARLAGPTELFAAAEGLPAHAAAAARRGP